MFMGANRKSCVCMSDGSKLQHDQSSYSTSFVAILWHISTNYKDMMVDTIIVVTIIIFHRDTVGMYLLKMESHHKISITNMT